MDFNSAIFLFLFLPVFMLAYHLAGYRVKLILGVLASILFYAWGNLIYIPMIASLVLVTHLLAVGIDHWRGRSMSLVLLWLGVVINIGLILGFKISANLNYPLGLSYVTFQALAYLFEVRKGLIENERNLLRFSFYLLLFPKLPVGPIVRYSQVRNQIAELKTDPLETANGLRRFIRGLAKKVLLADTLARVVDPIFKLSSPVIPPHLAWLVLISYSLQLFLDFSGYTDMAIGLGQMMGLRFVENFNFPYLSRSIGDFWRRWHMSLASWFRDFVFYPLERHRLKWIGQPLNILIVFLLLGLWHGLTRNFVIWGLIHGLALVFENTTPGKFVTRLQPPIRNLYALTVILFGWVIFRSPTPDFALDFLRRLVGDASGLRILPFDLTSPLPFIEPTFIMALMMGLLLCFPIGQWLEGLIQKRLGERLVARISAQVLYDFGMSLLLIASVAATASSAFLPSIYGKF
jgi:alginate O-acetyltransferase complex protein AlgI